MKKYDFKKVEAKWQKKWVHELVYEPNLKTAKKPFYNLMMFPYPSAEGLHVGNMYAFTGADIYGRFKRMQGYDVFQPIGLDGFGIHSENYALKIGTHPAKQAIVSEKRFYKQLESIGNGFAWNERLETYDPEYYKWTQWIFAEMFRKGLAYRKKQAVNWCPSCKTVLADEQVLQKRQETSDKQQGEQLGICERCGTEVFKKELEQWFFRITKYADRLLDDLKNLDWSERVKIAQENWIGKSEGALIKFQIPNNKSQIEVFTTRPDTLFGATYLVLSPEHEQITNLKSQTTNWREVEKYVEKAKNKKESDRVIRANDSSMDSTGSGQGKTGVELKGVKAINPATKEEIPIWVADYVLGSYGTGAIMAVPAHDDRDFEFAKKFKLAIREVVVPNRIDKRNPPVDGLKKVSRRNVHVIVRNPKDGKYLCLRWKKYGWVTFPMGGVEDGEGVLAAARREVLEETGYKNLVKAEVLGGQVRAEYFAAHKNENRVSYTTAVSFDLANEDKSEVAKEESEAHEVFWVDRKELTSDFMTHAEMDVWLDRLNEKGAGSYAGDGVLVNSEKFDGMDSEKAKREITKAVGGERKVQYRLRDWLISRQRYWGPPIPMIYCETCARAGKGEQKDMPGWYAVPEKDLPVKLPIVKDFRPRGTGESPLASVKFFYEVKCPKCKAKARRETDVSDTFLDSAWYYLRYLDSENKRRPFDKLRVRKWLPINLYTGGAEHSVLHLLYVRFLAKVLSDWRLVDFDEPAKKFRAHGLLIKDGAKMSKSKGNVINPDEYIKKFGADTLRMYLMFLAPFEQGGDFRDSGILGVERFLNRVWKLCREKWNVKHGAQGPNKDFERLMHKTIKKVTEDIESLNYNTAVSAMMILLNEMEKQKEIGSKYYLLFIKLLAPFAPHITEEIYQNFSGSSNRQTLSSKKFRSIHLEDWPQYDSKLIQDERFTLVIQVNGKVRDSVEVAAGISQADAEKLVFAREKVQAYLKGVKPKKVIYVEGRLINFVV